LLEAAYNSVPSDIVPPGGNRAGDPVGRFSTGTLGLKCTKHHSVYYVEELFMPRAGYCIWVLIVCSPLARGQVVATTQPNLGANAALLYWQAFDLLPSDDASLKILDNWDTVPLDSKVDDLLATKRSPLNYLHNGAQIPDCDWGLDFSQGPTLLLPFLNHDRTLMALAFLSARIDFQDGDFTPGVDKICDVLAMARHVGANGILVCHLVQCGIEREAIDLLAAHLKELDPPAIVELSSRLAQLPVGASLADSTKMEQVMVDWLIARMQTVTDDKISTVLTPVLDAKMTGTVDRAISDSGGTRAGATAALQNLRPYYDQVGNLLRQNPTQEEFHKRADDLLAPFANKPFANILFVNFGRAFDTDAGQRTQMQMLKAAIAIVQNGPDKIKDFTDPVNHDPLKYDETANGFELSSAVTVAGHPVVLKVGS
jgi:hypothetical protein